MLYFYIVITGRKHKNKRDDAMKKENRENRFFLSLLYFLSVTAFVLLIRAEIFNAILAIERETEQERLVLL